SRIDSGISLLRSSRPRLFAGNSRNWRRASIEAPRVCPSSFRQAKNSDAGLMHTTMNEPKLAVPVDTERLVRDFLDAFDSLKTRGAPLTCSSPAEEEQRPAQLQEGCQQAFELVGGNALSAMSAEPPMSGTPLEAPTGPGSDIDEQEPEQTSAFQGVGNPESLDYQIEAPKTQHEIIEEFCADHEVLERLQITPGEIQALSHAS